MKINWLFRSVLMNEADGGEGGGGGAVATVDTGAGLATTGGEGEGGEGEGTTTDLAVTGDTSVTSRDGKGNAIPRPVSEFFKSKPELNRWKNSAVQAIEFRQTMRKEFPGISPVAGVRALKQDMRGLAGRYYNQPDPNDPAQRTGIQQIKDKLAEMEDIDLLYFSADPRILDGMTGDEEGKAAFVKLRPHINSRFRQLAPKTALAEDARLTLSSLKGGYLYDNEGKRTDEQAEMDVRLKRMSKALYAPDGKQFREAPDLAAISEELNALWMYFTSVRRMTNLEPEVFTPQAKDTSQNDEREQRLNQREQKQKSDDWDAARGVIGYQLSNRLWKQLTKGHTIDADSARDTEALYHIRYDKAVKANVPDADDKRRAFLAANDKEGYLAFEKYLLDTYAVPALKTEVNKLLARLGGAKAKPKTGEPTAAASGKPQTIPTGYTKLSQKPSDTDIDYSVRTIDDIKAKRAVLRRGNSMGKPAGFRVCW